MTVFDDVLGKLYSVFAKGPPAVVRSAVARPAPSGDSPLQVAKTAAQKDPMAWGDDPHEALLSAWLGKTETDPKDREALKEFFKATLGTEVDPATTAWCAAMANAVLLSSYGSGTGSHLARDFLKFGEDVGLDPQDWHAGDVGVFSRGTSTWEGHVGFLKQWFWGDDGVLYLRIIAGNDKNKVREAVYSKQSLLGVRRAKIVGTAPDVALTDADLGDAPEKLPPKRRTKVAPK